MRNSRATNRPISLAALVAALAVFSAPLIAQTPSKPSKASDAKAALPKANAAKDAKPAKRPPAKKPDQPKGDKNVLQSRVPADLAQLAEMERQFEKVIERASPAVVGVGVGMGSGSAVVVSKDGLVLTAAHVCDEPNRPAFFRFPNGKTARGVTLGLHKSIDAGMMKITDTGDWPFVEMAKPDSLAIGDWVVALGHPGGFQSDRPPVLRVGRVLGKFGATLQTDCAIVGGDSGGPLFDLDGRVVGIHSRIGAQNTNNFHVPIESFWSDWDRLSSGESWGTAFWQRNQPPRARTPAKTPIILGVAWQTSPKGLRIAELTPNRPAADAGLKVGDVLTKFAGVKVATEAALDDQLGNCKAGQVVDVEIQRDDKTMTIQVKLAALAKSPDPKKSNK